MFDVRHLPNSLPGEESIFFLRRHPITISWILVSCLILMLAPILIAAWLAYVPFDFLSAPVIMPLAVIVCSALFLFIWLFLFQNFIDYYLDMWVVTTRRILNIEQTGLFKRTVSELRLYRIQDVTSTVSGMLHTFLDYGDVEIETAGEKIHFVFEDIKHPSLVGKRILELAEEDRAHHVADIVEENGGLAKSVEVDT